MYDFACFLRLPPGGGMDIMAEAMGAALADDLDISDSDDEDGGGGGGGGGANDQGSVVLFITNSHF